MPTTTERIPIDSTNIFEAVAVALAIIERLERSIGRTLSRDECADLLMSRTTWTPSETVMVIGGMDR